MGGHDCANHHHGYASQLNSDRFLIHIVRRRGHLGWKLRSKLFWTFGLFVCGFKLDQSLIKIPETLGVVCCGMALGTLVVELSCSPQMIGGFLEVPSALADSSQAKMCFMMVCVDI